MNCRSSASCARAPSTAPPSGLSALRSSRCTRAAACPRRTGRRLRVSRRGCARRSASPDLAAGRAACRRVRSLQHLRELSAPSANSSVRGLALLRLQPVELLHGLARRLRWRRPARFCSSASFTSAKTFGTSLRKNSRSRRTRRCRARSGSSPAASAGWRGCPPLASVSPARSRCSPRGASAAARSRD